MAYCCCPALPSSLAMYTPCGHAGSSRMESDGVHLASAMFTTGVTVGGAWSWPGSSAERNTWWAPLPSDAACDAVRFPSARAPAVVAAVATIAPRQAITIERRVRRRLRECAPTPSRMPTATPLLLDSCVRYYLAKS